jgi:hypothetical protein
VKGACQDPVADVPKATHVAKNAKFFNVHVIAKLSHEVSGDSYTCSKKEVTVTTFENFVGARHIEKIEKTITLDEDDCRDMVRKKECEWEKMTCEGSRCDYDGTPKEDYAWMRTTTTKGVICSFYKRRLIALTQDSKVFDTDCRVKDFSCKGTTSITIWDKSAVIACPYQHMAKISEVEIIENNIMQDSTSQYAYKIDKITICGFEAYKTTDDLLLVLDTYLIHGQQLPKADVELANIHTLMLAENDGRSLAVRQAIDKVRKEICKDHAAVLAMLEDKEDYYAPLRLLDGGSTVVVYVTGGLIFLPRNSTKSWG